MQIINVTRCPSNAASQVRINSCIHPKLKITLIFTLTLLFEIGRKCLDLKRHFVLDIKIGLVFLDIIEQKSTILRRHSHHSGRLPIICSVPATS